MCGIAGFLSNGKVKFSLRDLGRSFVKFFIIEDQMTMEFG